MEIGWSSLTIGPTDRERTEELSQSVKEERNILHTIERRKANSIGHTLRTNCLLKHVMEGKIEGRIKVIEIRGRRCEKLLDGFKETTGYWTL
jgi:hypothetical protein